MKSFIRWAIQNTPAMNTAMISILVVGILAGISLRREEFPRFELEIVLVQVPYPGASPDEVESGICQKIEESVRSIDGIKKVTSVAAEGAGSVIIELHAEVPSVQKVLNEIESSINRIPSFPDLAEEPEIQQLTIRNPAIKVAVMAEKSEAVDAELALRAVVERVRDDLLLIPQISVADIQGERDYQIDVEIAEKTLRQYGLSLQEVARRIRRQNLELPGGKIRDDSQVVLLRGKHKRLYGEEIAEIPLVTRQDGVTLTVGDLGSVRDEFVDTTSISSINGRPGMSISVDAAAREDMLAMTQAVKEYAATVELPRGYDILVWDDRSIAVNDRLNLLKKNGLQGLLLVFVVLALFLDLRLSFWVALGIPVSVLGACAVLWQFDQTMNMLSMFSFLIALGIVVDDAIVIGENIYAHREQGKSFLQAAVDGTCEVLPSVTTSVTTTIFAFAPMFFVTGVMGKFFAVMPLAVIAMLAISLFESALILPCHLAHQPHPIRSWTARARAWRSGDANWLMRWIVWPPYIVFAFLLDHLLYPFRRLGDGMSWASYRFGGFLDWVILRVYTPSLRFCLRRPEIPISVAVAGLLIAMSLVRNGTVPWTFFPDLDSPMIQATVVFPDGTPSRVTDEATRRIEEAIVQIGNHYAGEGSPVLSVTHRLVGQVSSNSPGGPEGLTEGSHAGAVTVELVENTQRDVTSQTIVDDWRREVGNLPGVESLTFQSLAMGPGGRAIEFKLLGPADAMESLEQAVEACKAKLATYPGVYDISDDSRPGKWEFQLQIKEDARSLGVDLEDVARAVRSAYYGEEVMRLQRGRHEVKLMVRYPADERHSIADFQELRVDTGDGVKRPITELADVKVTQGYSEINRLDQMRSITISADVDAAKANAAVIVGTMQSQFVPELLAQHPRVRVRWEGQQEQTVESISSLFLGLGVALAAMYVLLTLEFTSYGQPALIMGVIPFGLIGAVAGHAAMGLPLTLFSVLGLVALTGIVVNDSIVLVDFINARLRDGMPLRQALVESGQRRFRPVLLTSMTTVAGLLPLLTETSMQAQLLIPMANSLCFGLIFSTFLVLFLVPSYYLLYEKLTRRKDSGSYDQIWKADPPEEPVAQVYDSAGASPSR